ncbi:MULTISPECIES: ATP-grasp fold amidoligase family protein [Serratia]|uniref:ATP-grasp fold amidoligase family protein n=1 Tax=Serratia TaxID=613 RepID=UPI0004E32D13|nr:MULTISPECIES: ATP-grasp fold amidoligase family protein [Serratia]EME1467576.1 glycosyl transferase [Serratia marcescens]KFB54298.1 glycosyl transferase [Serratia marcescens]MBH2594770.1 glycosyl transferase [Serratia marcescens]MBH2634591.1 glycosyl transferase [Serratia marcescens]MBH2855390.1 glycosyl transferase [Serratia marcescens]
MKRQIIKFIIKQLAVLAPEFKARLLYKKAFGKPLNLQTPSTWNEKINHLKLNGYSHNALVKQCADKYAVREYIKEKGCEEILNELYFACDSVNDIPWDTLPDKFVIKGNHGSGYNLICQNKKLLNITSAKKLIDGWMKDDYWKTYVELNYKGIQKKIIGEKYIESANGHGPEDYKIYCFRGVPYCTLLCVGRDTGSPKYYFFDKDFKFLCYSEDCLALSQEEIDAFVKPEGYDELFEYASRLSAPFEFVRVDFYISQGRIIFGELTFTPSAGLDTDILPPTDVLLGEMLTLQQH